MTENRLKVNSETICGLCVTKQSKYCCPRCGVYYCSLDCYKSVKHVECSESFYRDCVNEDLASNYADENSRDKMIDILTRLHNQDLDDPEDVDHLFNHLEDEVDSDDEGESDLHERVRNLNLDDPDAVWKALTQDEQNEFEALLSNGDVGSLIPQWEPWWTYRKEEKLVETVNKSDKEKVSLGKCPQLKQVPKFSSLTNIHPSPAIRYNIMNVLASYAFIMRYFNGEVDPEEAATSILNICANLDANHNFEDPVIAVESVAQKCLQSQLIETDTQSLNVMKNDCFQILQGPSKENKHYYIKTALSNLHSIFESAKSTAKISKSKHKKLNKNEFSKKFPEHRKEHLPKLDLSKVKKTLKKLEYYLSYIESGSID